MCCSDIIQFEMFRFLLTFPMARRALSKNSIMPKKRKNTPNPVSPIPISVDFMEENQLITLYLAISDYTTAMWTWKQNNTYNQQLRLIS